MADESVVKLASLLLLTTKLWRHLVHAFFSFSLVFFPYYVYSSACSVLEHEVILARGSGTRICLLGDKSL